MKSEHRSGGLVMLLTIIAGVLFAPIAMADDHDSVLAFIKQYGELEGDLAAQAELMSDDRVFINGPVRQTDNARNMATQMAGREASERVNGGPTRFITSIEGPIVKVYGDVAVASFVRWFNTYPHNQPANPPGNLQWVTLVMVKDGRDWKITHTHQSPIN